MGQRQAPDVTRRRIHHVEAAENQAFFDAFQACGHLTQVRGEGLALRPRLRVADTVRRMNASLALAVGDAQGVQAFIRAVDKLLFGQRKVRG